MSTVARRPQGTQIIIHQGVAPLTVIGEEGFRAHDPSTTWDDGGIGAQMANEDLDQLQEALAAAIDNVREARAADAATYGAHQARDAVMEYGTKSYLDGAVIDGRATIVLDLSNQQAELRVCYDLQELLVAVLKSAQQQQDRTMLSALEAACRAGISDAKVPMPGERVRNESLRRLAPQEAAPLPVEAQQAPAAARPQRAAAGQLPIVRRPSAPMRPRS